MDSCNPIPTSMNEEPTAPAPATKPRFDTVFRRYCRRRRFAAFFAAIVRTAAFAVCLLLLFALLDYSLTFEETARRTGGYIWRALVGLYLLYGLLRACSYPRRKLAEELDAMRHDSRRSILSAWELEANKNADTSNLGQWLREQATQQTASDLKTYLRRSHAVLKRFAFPLLGILLLAGFCTGIYTAWPKESLVVLNRLMRPELDTPPLSPYTFTVKPAVLEVHYGGDLLIQAEVEGPALEGTLELWVRQPGLAMQKLPAFREKDNTWARRLEKVTQACEIAFATDNGKARSHWHPVRINYRPRITAGTVTVTPPAYTRMPAATSALSGQEITVPEGGAVTYTIQSNRSLSSGTAVYRSERPGAVDETVQGKIVRENTCIFTLPVRYSGSLTIDLKDTGGDNLEKPLESKIRTQSDLPPVVNLRKPSEDCFVVIGYPFELEAEASDDYGLVRFDLNRNTEGTRPRSTSILGTPGDRDMKTTLGIDLRKLGAQPGDVFELGVEAQDANPYRLNITTSPTVKVTVISEEEYAEMLRMEASLEDFKARYEELQNELNKTIEELAAAENIEDPAKRAEALEKIKQQHQKTKKLAETIAKDFPIFDSDKQLSALAEQLASELQQNMDDAAKTDPQSGMKQWNESMKQMQARLGASAQNLNQQKEDAEKAANVAAIMELLYEFQALTEEQKEMQNRFLAYVSEMKQGRRVTTEQLEALGEDQQNIHDRLETWSEKIPKVIENLPDEAAKFKDILLTFQAKYSELDIPEIMEAAIDESRNLHHAPEAYDYASQAYEAMKKLLDETMSNDGEGLDPSECLSGACQSAARQMMEALCKQCQGQGNDPMKNGQGNGAGAGYGGNGARPSMPGSRSIVGPPRSKRAGSGSAESSHSAQGGQGNRGNNHSGNDPGKSSPSPSEAGEKEIDFSDSNWEQVPPTYRDAVRKYFKPANQ